MCGKPTTFRRATFLFLSPQHGCAVLRLEGGAWTLARKSRAIPHIGRQSRMKPQRWSKNSFRTQYTGDARVSFDRLAQRPRGGFESAFQNVMRVATAQTVDMQIEICGF